MKILVAAATLPEVEPFGQWLDEHFVRFAPGHYQRGSLQISLLLTGIGMPQMAYAMGRVLALEQYDLAINPGIGGSLDPKLKLGRVVEITHEMMADLGAEDHDGSFIPAHQFSMLRSEDDLFDEHGWLHNPYSEEFDLLPKVKGISVNQITGSEPSILALKNRVSASVESMEGAAFFYACKQANVPFLEIRSISNFVEPRNREAWKIPLAIDRLNEVLIELIETIS